MSVTIKSNTDLDSDFSAVTNVWVFLGGIRTVPFTAQAVATGTISPGFFTDQRFPNLRRLHIIAWSEDNKNPLVVQSSSLENLMAESAGIEEVILDCPKLTKLIISNNYIRSLDLKCPSLKYLICHHNELSELSLEISSLEVLDCSVNRLSKLHLECPFLRQLHCVYNQLSEIPLSLPFLECLSCTGNPLLNLHGLEFSSLRELAYPPSLAKEAMLLKVTHFPDLRFGTGPSY